MQIPAYLTEDRYTIRLPGRIKGVDRELVPVRRTSPLTQRRAVERFAYYFKREFGYDFPQFEADDLEDDFRAWLLASDTAGIEWRAVGATCFRQRDDEDDGTPFWALQWIWLHPYFRGEGHLKRAWPVFLAEIGEAVDVEAPFSRAMVSFLRTVDPETLKEPLRQAIKSGKPLNIRR